MIRSITIKSSFFSYNRNKDERETRGHIVSKVGVLPVSCFAAVSRKPPFAC